MEELFEALWANPFDDEHRLVVADALQQIGDPQGELAILQHRRADNLRVRERELIAQIAGDVAWLDRASDTQVIGLLWHLGWIRRARLQLHGGEMTGDYEQAFTARAERLFATRAAKLVEHLELSVTRHWTRNVLFEDLIVMLIAHGPYPALRVLEIGGFIKSLDEEGTYSTRDLSAVYITNKTWPDGARICVLMAMCPRLEEVRLQGNVANLGAIDLPSLRVFELCTSSLGSKALASLAAANWPALERLVLWFGDCEYGGGDPCTADEVARFVVELETKCPALRHLAIANSPCTDAIVYQLAAEPPRELFGRLTGLDLSLGTLTTPGAHVLAGMRPWLPSLTLLDVSQNYLGTDALGQLTKAYHGCELRTGPQSDDLGEPHYVSIGE